MKILNPMNIFNDFKSGKIDSSKAIEKLLSIRRESRDDKLRLQVSDVLLEMYRSAEAHESVESEKLEAFMERTIGKKFISKYKIIPREAMGLVFLEMATGVELENDDEIPELHHVHAAYRIKESHIIDIDIVEVCCPKVTFLDLFPNLVFLRINMAGLKEIKGLEKLGKLEWLDLGANELTDIKGLENLQSLKKLHIYFNRFSQLNGLDSLTVLEELFIHENPIRKLKGIKRLKKLKTIVFYETNLSEKEVKKIKKLIKSRD